MTFATERILFRFQVFLLWFQKHMWYYIKYWINLWKQLGYDVFQNDSPSYHYFFLSAKLWLPYGLTLQLFLEALTLLDVCHPAPPWLRCHLICQDGETRQKKDLSQPKCWKIQGSRSQMLFIDKPSKFYHISRIFKVPW